MKKLYILIISILLFIFDSNAQSITSFTVIPSQPTSADTVMVIIQCDFGSGGCDGMAMLAGINGNTIVGTGSHCIGMLTVLCTDYDTVIIPPLTAGTYSFEFTLISGDGFPCVPGSLGAVMNTTSFTVSNTTGLNEINIDNSIQILPNPSKGKFVVKQKEEVLSLLKIYSIDGRLLNTYELKNIENEIQCFLSPGIYTVVYESNLNRYFAKMLIQN